MEEEITGLRKRMIRNRVLIAGFYVVIGAIYVWFAGGAFPDRAAQSLGISAGRFAMILNFSFVAVSGGLFLAASRLFDLQHLNSYRELLTSQKHLAELEHFERLGEIAGGLSHDLRNLLQVLQLHISNRRQQSESDEDRAVTNRLRNQSERLLQMSDALTEAFTSTEQEHRSELVDLDQFIHRQLELIRPMMSRGEIVFRNNLEEVEIEVDRLVLHRLILNLLQNAASAAGEGGRIELELGEDGTGNVQLLVSNTGNAIPRVVIEKFNEEIELSRTSGGHGWGLNIIQTTAAELGAKIEAHVLESERGGARFRVSFGEADSS